MASTAHGGGSAVSTSCATCKRVQPREEYTNRQWKLLSSGTGRCRGCVSTSDPTAAGKARKRKASAPAEVQERAPFAVSAEELEACVAVLRQFHERSDVFLSKPYRALRKAMQPLLSYQSEQQYGSVSRDEYNSQKRRKVDEQRRRQREHAMDTEVINRRQMRSARLAKLQELIEGGAQGLPLIPDGAVDTEARAAPTATIEDVDEEAEAAAAAAGGGAVAAAAAAGDGDELQKPRSCYACKGRFRKLHQFYSDLCPPCAKLNFTKRVATAPLGGRIALLTGGRVKIGYQSGLKLLRCGATVIVTTRFPKDCALRYAQEKDSAKWSARLRIVGLDFRDVAAVSNFCDYMIRTLPALDMIVNNACQTIRRPPAYYRHMLATEHMEASEMPHGAGALLLLPNGSAQKRVVDGVADGAEEAAAAGGAASVFASGSSAASSGGAARLDPTALSSAEQSQIALTPGDAEDGAASFPTGKLDTNAQQIDLRRHNSWLLKLEDVEIPELAEVFTINAFAPFIFNSKLKPLLLRSSFQPRFIINVCLRCAVFCLLSFVLCDAVAGRACPVHPPVHSTPYALHSAHLCVFLSAHSTSLPPYLPTPLLVC